MSEFNYNSYVAREAQKASQNTQKAKINYFALKNDKDEAIVRIMHDSTDDFDMLIVHPTTIDGRKRNIKCLRSPEEPIDKCPFCAANQQLRSKIYIHMLQYTRNADGSVTTTPVLWDRSANYAVDIANKIETYGPLSDCLFKIRRNGVAGSVNTTYSIDYIPVTPNNAELYKKDTSLFNDIKALGTAVMQKDAKQMEDLLQSQNTASENIPNNNSYADPVQPVMPNNSYNNQSYVNTAPNPINFNNQNSEEIVRPKRYY